MSDPTVEPQSWLIDASHWPNTLEKMKAEGALVPDPRLQAIADAHQRYMAHIDNDDMDDAMSARRERDALLDALTEKNSE